MSIDAEALFTANQHRLFRYFHRAVGQSETARDLTQDVFVRVSRVPVPVAPEGELRAWLFRIARNLAIDYHRKRLHEPDAGESLVEASRHASQDIDFAVNEALRVLADVDRDVFLMREVAGLGYDEIANACGLSPDAVRSRIHRARLELRRQLAGPVATRRRRRCAETAERSGSRHERYTRGHFSVSRRRTV